MSCFGAVLVIGETGIKPILGTVGQGTLAATAGFVEGDQIISVNDKLTPTWTEAMGVIIASALDGDQEIKVTVKNFDDQPKRQAIEDF